MKKFVLYGALVTVLAAASIVLCGLVYTIGSISTQTIEIWLSISAGIALFVPMVLLFGMVTNVLWVEYGGPSVKYKPMPAMRGPEVKITFVDEFSQQIELAKSKMAIMNPDCRDEKHRPCSGDGWSEILDQPCPCPCICHEKKEDDA